jgi:transposase-like protein
MARTAGISGREQHWRQVVAQWRRSGLTVRAFCLKQGLSDTLFYWWRRELERRDGLSAGFLPVRVTHGEVTPQAKAGVEIVLANGRCLRVRPGFDHATLVEVVDLLDEGGASC